MLKKFLLIFFVSMVPLIELRGAIIMAVGMDLPYLPSLAICVLGNLLPVPVIYFFARKVLIWGAHRKYIGKFFTFCIEKGEKGGQKLVEKTGRGGLFIALFLFVGIPLPGTGAWTGALVASLLNIRMKVAFPVILGGVVIAGIIVTCISCGIFAIV